MCGMCLVQEWALHLSPLVQLVECAMGGKGPICDQHSPSGSYRIKMFSHGYYKLHLLVSYVGWRV